MENRSITYALAAAVLFGVSTPFAKLLVGEVAPLMLGGLLYLGSGIGLGFVRAIRDRGWSDIGLARKDVPWLMGAILFGGVLGPVALMFGLSSTNASTASLMLNLEAVMTALLAWIVFKENADRRIVAGMVCIVAGGIVLTWPTASADTTHWRGPVAISDACLFWAIDNNLTRKVSASDALFIAGSKGLAAGLVNCTLAVHLGMAWPGPPLLFATMSVGLLGYGVSLVLFVLALRGLGAARTGAYFSVAPFIGAAVALFLLREPVTTAFWVASALMGLGVWLHLTERHTHSHGHELQEHSHGHVHDTHHQHDHSPPWDGREPHDHWHQHTALVHDHVHYPDIHHRHAHDVERPD